MFGGFFSSSDWLFLLFFFFFFSPDLSDLVVGHGANVWSDAAAGLHSGSLCVQSFLFPLL